MIKTYEDYINEMAMATENMRNNLWYHGTSEENALKIMKDGYVKPSEAVTTKTRGYMSPQFNKVYLTSSLEEGIGYAFFRNGKSLNYGNIGLNKSTQYAYLIIIDGKELNDLNPDEDIIADNIDNLEWLKIMAKNYAPNEYKKYMSMGDYAYGTKIGKKLMNYLSDKQKIELIELGGKVAHDGKINIKEVWKIDMNERVTINKNINDWKKYSTKIF